MRKYALTAGAVAALVLVAVATYVYYHRRWEPLRAPAVRQRPYAVRRSAGDTLHVVMIGDSWAGMHHEGGLDSLMQAELEHQTGRRVRFTANGRGGAKSGDVYRYMFRCATSSGDMARGYCTQALIEQRPDYCIVMAGINDAIANLGTDYYCSNYLLIVRWLLQCGIRPVVVEMPDVNLKDVYADKPLRHKVSDHLKAWMAGCGVYDVRDYREALAETFRPGTALGDSVVYVPCATWNAAGFRDGRRLYMDDDVHLNRQGYRLLDACLATRIASDAARCPSANSRPSAPM